MSTQKTVLKQSFALEEASALQAPVLQEASAEGGANGEPFTQPDPRMVGRTEAGKRVLLINRGADSDNLGDRAIQYTLTRLLEEKGCRVTGMDYIKPVTRRGAGLFEVIREAGKRYDLVMIGGGQLILSNRSFFVSFLLWIWAVRLLSRSRIVLFGVGASDHFTLPARICYRLGLFSVDEVYVRDHGSADRLRTTFGKTAYVVPDVVTVISDYYRPMRDPSCEACVLFGITHWSSIRKYGWLAGSEKEYLKQQAKLFMEFPAGDRPLLFSNTAADYEYALRFRDYLKDRYGLEAKVRKPSDLEDYLNLVAHARLVVSGRMHALITALSYGVDVAPVIRNRKLEAFVDEYLPFDPDRRYAGILDETLNSILEED